MTPQGAFCELLARLGASKGAPVLISGEELSRWPAATVKAMKSEKLLVKARSANTAVCPGCEQECVMPVHTRPTEAHFAAPFIVCDKRSDINRVELPISRLEQWQASGLAIADLLATLLALRRPNSSDTSTDRWEIGVFKGTKYSSHLVLLAEIRLMLSLAGHSIALADILTFESDGLKLDKPTLANLVNKPIAGAGDAESASLRRARLKKCVQGEKNKGNKSFLKTVAEDERISVSRLKQLLTDESKPSKRDQSRRSAY